MISRDVKTYASVFGLFGLAALNPATALAQTAPANAPAPATSNAQATLPADTGGEIVVTAQRRNEREVDVPITITALNTQALQTANVQQLSDIEKLTPALRFDNAGAFWQPTIRGVGTPVTTSGGGTNVGVYVDGFYSPNPLANDFQFLNVESVQVLKGPQGTLFGHNTTGGAIVVQTADPSTTPALDAKISYGRFNAMSEQAYVTTGITDNIAVDVEGLYKSGDGYLTNIQTGDDKVGKYDDYTVRTGIKAQITPGFSALFRYTHSYVNDPTSALVASYYDPSFGPGYPYYAQPGQYTFNPSQVATGTQPGEQPFIHTQSDVEQLTLKADLGFANFTSYSQIRSERVNALIQLDYSGVEEFGLGLPNSNATKTQEFLFTSKPGSRLQWTAGFFYLRNRDTYFTYIDYLDNFVLDPASRLGGSSTTTVSYAGFVDATYQLADKLFLTAGVRYSHDEVKDAYFNSATDPVNPTGSAAYPIPVPNISSNHATPRAVIRYKPDNESSVYASFAEGYKAAIIDVGGSCQDAASNFGNPPFTCNPIKPEKIDAYEVGYKFDDHRFSFDLSAFYYNYRDLQVSVYLSGTAYILNAASSHIYGLDGQFNAKLTDHFDIQAAGAYTHARFVDFQDAPVYVPFPIAAPPTSVSFIVPGENLTNSPMERTPEFSGNVMLRYKHELAGGKLVLSSNLNYTSKIYFGYSGNQFPQSAYATMDLRAQWTDPSDRYTVAVFGANVTDERYKTEVQATNFGVGANWSAPVTYGVEAGVKF